MKKILSIISLTVGLVFTSCEDFLDRTSLTTMNDDNYWTSENNVRLFANGFYPNYFVGYNSSWSADYTPLRGYTFSDDYASTGQQSNFEALPPSSRIANTESVSMLTQYAGPNWNFAWVRKSNYFLERIESIKSKFPNEEAYLHWTAVGRFFRGFEYSRLTSVFGDVPYFDKVIKDSEVSLMYKDRDDRTEVMDKVYDDFVFVLDNMKLADINVQYLNRYIAASFISRLMLFEGTWQKYHLNNPEKSKKYLELAVRAADLVMISGKYTFTSDFRSLFGSEDLASNKEVIMYRKYDATQTTTHSIASYSNGYEGQTQAANLQLAKAFLCNDGKPYTLTSVANGSNLDIKSMVATRDPRFEATFWDAPRAESATLLYVVKFTDRVGPTYYPGPYPAIYTSNTNTSDAPVIRLAEVVLNWIEAKAELATIGGTAVTQADIDASINAIRKRPLGTAATAKGIKQTAPMLLATLFDDPERDADVPALIWEIRRERRMEFVYEHSRLLDIKRWKKIDYMKNTDPDNMLGLWINFNTEFPAFASGKSGKLKVKQADGSILTYNGSNLAQMEGFYIPENSSNRNEFSDRVYLAPVGLNQITDYKDKGFTLTQTPGWE
jgi:uncharacterized protein YozE (UPF0346 family)